MLSPSISTTLLPLFLSLICSPNLSNAASPSAWRNRSIYQILTDRFALTNGSTSQTCNTGDQVYCGGTWQGIISHLDYVQGMGFDAIWISPVTKQLEGHTSDGSAYHGYWQQDIYELNEHFGTQSDLEQLASEVHKRGMYLMVDVVFNHFCWIGSTNANLYNQFNPFNSASDFHPYCQIDYSNTGNITQLQVCWGGDNTVPLVDVKTEDSSIASTYQSWIAKDLVPTYSIDGFRVDSALEMNTGFWSGMRSATNDIYMVGEVDNSNIDLVCSYQDYMSGVLNYGLYGALIGAFQSTSGNMQGLVNAINNVKSSCSNTSYLGTFSENHDVPRFGQLNPDINAAKNVLVFTMLTDGIPIVYEGQEQHYQSLGGSGVPWNREAIWFSDYNTNAPLYQLVKTLNAARKQAIKNDATYLAYMNYPIHNDGSTIATKKGAMVMVMSNQGSNGGSYTLTFNSAGYNGGEQLTELLTCNTLTVDSNGNMDVPMNQGLPRVYYPTSMLGGSGIC